METEMKDSKIPWIGKIPKEWSVIQLSSIFKEHKDKNRSLEENNLLSLSYGKIIRKDINTKEGLLPKSFDGYNIIQKGDIVFRLTDLQNDKRSLRTALCKEKGIITSAYITIRKTQELHPEYFHFLLHSYDECKVFYGLGDGVRQGMTFDDLKKLLLVVPPTNKQIKIVSFLEDKCADIDNLIILQQQMIDELKVYKQSVITEAVCKGLDKSVPMKDSGIEWIGDVPIHTEICSFRRLISKYDGGLIRSNEELNRGDVAYFKMNNIDTFGNCSFQDLVLTEANAEEIKKYSLGEDDFLINVRNSYELVGKVGLVKDPPKNILFNHMINRVILNKTLIYPTFLKYYFVSDLLKFEYSLYKKGTTSVVALYKNDILKLHIILYPISVQKDISNYLDQKASQIDNLISVKQQKIDELKEYKKSMIYEYITGKKEVEI